MKTEIETTELQTIDIAALEDVTGGNWRQWAGKAWDAVSGLFGGGGGGTNVNIQNGNGNRTAQGNSGNVNQGDTIINGPRQ